MRIYLIGFMGSGKSFVGRRLAMALEWPFIDLDEQIVASAGQSIVDIFANSGEQTFRKLEQTALHQTSHFEKAIISTGGGAPCFFDNISWMNQQGITIYLNADPSLLASRLAPQRMHRPLIKDLDDHQLITFIEQKLAERNVFYTQAKYLLSFDQNDTRLIDQIIELIRSRAS